MLATTAVILIGSTGSGTTFLSRYVVHRFDEFRICKKVTARRKRTNEVAGAVYRFVDGATFRDLLTSGRLALVKFSDFDNTRYGIEEGELTDILRDEQSLVLACHSLEEAQTLKYFWRARKVIEVCIYVCASEHDRKLALARSGETRKYFRRYYMDMAFKIQAYQKQFADSDYFVANRNAAPANEQCSPPRPHRAGAPIRMLANSLNC